MEFLTRLLRSQLSVVNKLADVCSVKKSRVVQDKVGSLMAHEYQASTVYHPIEGLDFEAGYLMPETLKHDGVILYLHGGGYVSGGMQYAKGFGSVLAVQNQIAVCCAAYRLAPEHVFPAAVDDALAAYQYLLENGYTANQIVLCGESAGGGLVYALALRLKAEHLPQPCGIVAISPWSDLTMSGMSYQKNLDKDPSMTRKRLQFYAECYTEEVYSPYASPVFGDLAGLPPSIIFVGGSEIMMSDSVLLHQNLRRYGCQTRLHIAPDMWHIYLLYGIKEAKEDLKKITAFLEEVLHDRT